MTAGIGRV